MLFNLFLIFIVVPALEIYVLVQVAKTIGAWDTLAVLIFMAMAGVYLARKQGQRAWSQGMKKMQQGGMPGDDILSGILVFIGGLLLIFPGFLTDVLGVLLVIPWTRSLFVKLMKRRIEKSIASGQVRVFTAATGNFYEPKWRDVTEQNMDSPIAKPAGKVIEIENFKRHDNNDEPGE